MKATVKTVRGNVLTIVNAKGVEQQLELVSAKDIAPGMPTGWCEDDCRTISVDRYTFGVKNVLALGTKT